MVIVGNVATFCIEVLAQLVGRLDELLDDERAGLVLLLQLLFENGVKTLIQGHVHFNALDSRHLANQIY